ncbi:MAG TPA: hypothetical protein VH475_00515 [Tepidisphaeraceae bacterium]|jgi:hypothetical protein
MPLEGEMKRRLERVLGVVDDHNTRGTRLLEDAQRLCARIRRLIERGVIPAETDPAALEVACHALQLPLKSTRGGSVAGRLGRTNLRERAEQAAEMLVGLVGDVDDESLLDETTRLLVQVHQREPEGDQAKLLADALNLEDFGVSGLILQSILVARQGGGVTTVADGCDKREQYGYWEARLKDGFHFEQTRAIAKQRLEQARRTATLLARELKEDGVL